MDLWIRATLDRSSGQFDIVLCNVVCGPMLMLEPILTALGKEDSVLVLAGIKAYQSPQVQPLWSTE
jgi:ribosomal protein L11 methylase PrmA